MPATYTKAKLSGSTNGRGIKVVQTATAGTLIHTAVSGTTQFDEVWLYCINTSVSSVKLTIEYGGVSAPSEIVEFTVPAEDGLYAIIPGLVIQNSLVIRAFAATTNVLIIHGFVNKIVN